MRILGLLIVLMIVGFLVFKVSNTGEKPVTPASAKKTVKNAEELACKQNLKMLNDFVKTYMSTHGIDNPTQVTLNDLLKDGLQLPECPAGGEYVFEDGKFYCTVHSKDHFGY